MTTIVPVYVGDIVRVGDYEYVVTEGENPNLPKIDDYPNVKVLGRYIDTDYVCMIGSEKKETNETGN